jgi:hypothetical protein
LLRGKILAAAVDEEVQHRHRRTERFRLAPSAAFGGSFERTRNGFRVALFENTLLEVQRVAAIHHFCGPFALCHV